MNAGSPSVQIELWDPDSEHTADDVGMLGELLHACVNAGASVSFILPFSCDEAAAFWRDKVLPMVHAKTCCVFMARSTTKIVGTVQLDLATPPNQPHRAEVR
jgi:hypothetical protein